MTTSSPSKAVIIDLDGTVANIDHRLHFINKTPKDWEGFNADILTDEPKQSIIDIINAIAFSGVEVLVVTGRFQLLHAQTVSWLLKHRVSFDIIFMRANGDYRADHIIKKEIYENKIKNYYDVQAVFEDRNTVVAMWRELGLTCLQVQQGDY